MVYIGQMIKAITLLTVILFKKPFVSRGRARRALTKRVSLNTVLLQNVNFLS